jgi:hypothetical protein
VSRPPTAFDMMMSKEGARLPEITVAPDAHGTLPDCVNVMRVVPVDPSYKSNMPTVLGDGRVDPKMVIKAPECQPRR